MESEVICGNQYSVCLCGLPPHDEDQPHECGRASVLTTDGICKGSWTSAGEIVRYPTGDTDEEAARVRLRSVVPRSAWMADLASWCEADNCPAEVCNGPHRAVKTTLGVELLRADQTPIGTVLEDE